MLFISLVKKKKILTKVAFHHFITAALKKKAKALNAKLTKNNCSFTDSLKIEKENI